MKAQAKSRSAFYCAIVLACLLFVYFIAKGDAPSVYRHKANSPKPARLSALYQCYSATSVSTNMAQAEAYYKSFMEAFREIVPRNFKAGYASPCWDAQYKVKLISTTKVSATVNGVTQCTTGERKDNIQVKYGNWQAFGNSNKSFTSSLICLPSIFVIGFPKCGTTFLWCLIKHILYSNPGNFASIKEINWWVDRSTQLDYPERTTEDVCWYMTNFISEIDRIANHGEKKALLFDGGPNIMLWPRHNKNDDPFANFCLLPSAMTQLIPGAKFIVTMRNPVDMVFSEFLYECKIDEVFKNSSEKARFFHNKVSPQVDLFFECLANKSGRDKYAVESNYNFFIREMDKHNRHILYECVHVLQRLSDSVDAQKSWRIPGNCGKMEMYNAFYYLHLKKWLSVVPRENFLYITLDELKRDDVANKTANFLGVESHFPGMKSLKCNGNEGKFKSVVLLNETKRMLEQVYQPFNELLAELLNDSKLLWP